jgi:hypothetical protein
MDTITKYNFLTPDECDKVVKIILSLEDTVKKLGPDHYMATCDDSLTGRYKYFNFLNDRTINSIVAPKLKDIFGSCVVQCWANIFRPGEGIGVHIHVAPDDIETRVVASGNIFLYGDPNIGTYYDGIKHTNKVGELSVISPYMPHGVPENETNDMRISMAIDVHRGPEGIMNMLSTRNPERYFYIK